MPIKTTGKLVRDITGSIAELRRPTADIHDLQQKISSLTDDGDETSPVILRARESGLKHVAIIMDGNGRWAKSRGLPRVAGHREGVAAARRAIETAKELGLSHLTLYSFSYRKLASPRLRKFSISWNLMKHFIETDLDRLVKENIRVRIIGDKATLPDDIFDLVARAEKETADNDGYFLQIAFNYGGRDELIRAMKTMAAEIAEGSLEVDDINEAHISAVLDTGNSPDPDLVIRTSGEQRISNFLLWQAAYAEFVFLDEMWPDFNQDVFLSCCAGLSGARETLRRYRGIR